MASSKVDTNEGCRSVRVNFRETKLSNHQSIMCVNIIECEQPRILLGRGPGLRWAEQRQPDHQPLLPVDEQPAPHEELHNHYKWLEPPQGLPGRRPGLLERHHEPEHAATLQLIPGGSDNLCGADALRRLRRLLRDFQRRRHRDECASFFYCRDRGPLGEMSSRHRRRTSQATLS